MSIFPNPSNGFFIISPSRTQIEKVTIIITNTIGEIVQAFTSLSDSERPIQMTNISTGVYFITAITSLKFESARITIW